MMLNRNCDTNKVHEKFLFFFLANRKLLNSPNGNLGRCSASLGPKLGGLKFSMARKKSSEKCQLGEVPIGRLVPVGGQNLTLERTFFFPVL